MGPFPMALKQLKFLVVGIYYFTKWVKVEPQATIYYFTFVWTNIICRYRIPRVLISDNGKQFNNSAFRDFCSELGIRITTHLQHTRRPTDKSKSRTGPC